jgi:RND family efflux transporter MFP subunit
LGQRLNAGDVIASLDPASLQLQVESAQAVVDQARSAAENAQADFERQQTLLERGSTTRVTVDDARTQAETSAASLDQAEKSLGTAVRNLEKSVLTAPFDGIINSVEVDSFATVGVGTPIVSLYQDASFEVAFSVNFDTVNRLVVGKEATVRLADRPDITLNAVVSEIGSRADAVSSFPIVLELRGSHPLLKAGMAVEAAIEFPLMVEEGFPIPLSAVIKDGKSGSPAGPDKPSTMGVYVFDRASSTVQRREVTVGGVRENSLIVIDGLQAGDLVASAGVSFLQDGQEVKLLNDGN